MTTLTEFLLARIAEDEAVGFRGIGEPSRKPLDTVDLDDWPDVIVAHSSRVLAECKAKRAIVQFHGSEILGICQEYDGDTYPCRTLRALAQPYADHADFESGWAL